MATYVQKILQIQMESLEKQIEELAEERDRLANRRNNVCDSIAILRERRTEILTHLESLAEADYVSRN